MIIQDTYYSRESTSNISSELGYILALTNSSDLYNNYVENIKTVTAEDVKTAAEKFLGQNRTFDPAKHYLWPIPQTARDKNTNLSQNPNW